MTNSVPTSSANPSAVHTSFQNKDDAAIVHSFQSKDDAAIEHSFEPVNPPLANREIIVLKVPRKKESLDVEKPEKPEFECNKKGQGLNKYSATAPLRAVLSTVENIGYAGKWIGYGGKWIGKNSWAQEPESVDGRPNWHTDTRGLKTIVKGINAVANGILYAKKNLQTPAPIYNQLPYRAKDYVQVSPEEEKKTKDNLNECIDFFLPKYNKGKKKNEKISKEDIVGKYIHHSRKSDGSANLNKKIGFSITYRKRSSKTGDYIIDKDNHYTYESIILFNEKLDLDVDYDNPLLKALKVIDNSITLSGGENRKTYQTAAQYYKAHEAKFADEAPIDQSITDTNLCSYHAALTLLKNKDLKSTKEEMDVKAKSLKRKTKLSDEQQDILEVISKGNLINKDKFEVEKTYDLKADSTKGLKKEQIKLKDYIPIPKLALDEDREDNSLEKMFNNYLQNNESFKLPADYKDKAGNEREIEKEDIRYVKTPSNLILAVERDKIDEDTKRTIKIDTPIEVEDSISLEQKSVDKEPKTNYLLKGFIYHEGTAEDGHYITYKQNPENDKEWIIFDNSYKDENGNYTNYGKVIEPSSDNYFDDRKNAAVVYLYEEKKSETTLGKLKQIVKDNI